MSLYLHANGIAATVLSAVNLDKVLLLRLEKIIPTALIAIIISPFLALVAYYGLGCDLSTLGNNRDFVFACVFLSDSSILVYHNV